MDDKTNYEWGRGQPLAPSVKRIDPIGWVVGSSAAGLVFALAGLALVWRPILGFDAPPGALSDHLGFWVKWLIHLLPGKFFGGDVRLYLRALDSFDDSQRMAFAVRCGFGLSCFLLPWALFADSYLRPRDQLIHMRGSNRLTGDEARRALNVSLRGRVKRRPDHEVAPDIPYPADLWTRHMLIVGGTGSGKSTVMKPLISKVIAAQEPMLLFDPKGDFTESFKQPAILAPWDARSLAWDIARDMRNPADMRRFAAAIIRESHDPMWSNASRQVLVGLMIYLRKTRGEEWGWMELRDLITQPQPRLHTIMERWHPEAARAVEKASVTSAGILINLSSFCSAIVDLAEAWGHLPRSRRVSFVDWVSGRSKFKQIILQGHAAYGELTKSYVESIVGVVSALVNSVEMGDDPNRKLWFIADELPQMGKIPMRSLFEVGRSRGVRCVIACQDFAQLEEIHGAQMVKAMVGMCGTLVVGQMMQGETADQLCKAFGSREVERANLSSSFGPGGVGANRSTTLSYSRDDVPLYKPSELSSRLGLTHDGSATRLILFTGGDAYELDWPIQRLPKRRARFAPADWTIVGKALPREADRPASPATADPDAAESVPKGEGARPPSGPRNPALEVDLAEVFGPPRASIVVEAFIGDSGRSQGASTDLSGELAEPIAEAAAGQAMESLGAAPVAVLGEASAALDAMRDSSPAPMQHVRVEQAPTPTKRNAPPPVGQPAAREQ
ncbi:type IV secretion system DNA-binding domain-containing protein [Paucibacter sp. R3-3]|uniref:Type IV secretion system DNA-binding domain-containing protein n=1 Tax=Roseateles agri TaxID=3098619 RepID=A0ABU5DNT4_9BURK|nr:type IV secretion system DNA-binding domain-containing protein [Paucibacter sp. R3-3]MDY0747943.1 type IV secretion system DNA-binding domain-containing protein [Paucibacter sp. R3-3]